MGTGGGKQGGGCDGCLTRTPWATLVALLMCWAGVAVFCGTMYRGINVTLRLLQDVFKIDRDMEWVQPTQLAFVILGASMAAIALMILVSSFLVTGATRAEVYRSHVGRVGGRVATACFIFITYILLVAWILVLFCCIIVTVFYTLSWGTIYIDVIWNFNFQYFNISGVCSTKEIQWDQGSIDFYPFNFLFPEGSQRVNMLVEGPEIKQFCIDYVQRAEIMFLLATAACVLVIMSLVHFLMTLSANYVHIRGHDKFTDLLVCVILCIVQWKFLNLVFQDLHNMDVTSESVQLTELDNNKYVGAGWQNGGHHGIQEYTM